MHSSVKLRVSMCYLTFKDVMPYIQKRQVLRKSRLPGCRKAGTSREKNSMQSKLLGLTFVCGISENQMHARCFQPLLYLKLLGASAGDDWLAGAASCSAFPQTARCHKSITPCP